MVSATESLYGKDAALAVDPYVDDGIEEAEITTVLLSEAGTAREGVALLTSIYENAGAAGGSGVFIGDQNETWFVEIFKQRIFSDGTAAGYQTSDFKENLRGTDRIFFFQWSAWDRKDIASL